MIFAHRGASSYVPENTIEAAVTAVFMDADFVLVDVVLTKDQIPIVMHDPGLKRTTNINSTLSGSTCDVITKFIPELGE